VGIERPILMPLDGRAITIARQRYGCPLGASRGLPLCCRPYCPLFKVESWQSLCAPRSMSAHPRRATRCLFKGLREPGALGAAIPQSPRRSARDEVLLERARTATGPALSQSGNRKWRNACTELSKWRSRLAVSVQVERGIAKASRARSRTCAPFGNLCAKAPSRRTQTASHGRGHPHHSQCRNATISRGSLRDNGPNNGRSNDFGARCDVKFTGADRGHSIQDLLAPTAPTRGQDH